MTALANLLERIVGRQKAREQERVTSYRQMVAQIAAGKEVDAETVERLLLTTGKSTDDLAAAVELYQRRVALRAQLDRVPEIEKEQKEISKQFAAAKAILDAAEEKYEETTRPLRARSHWLKEEAGVADRAKKELVECCPYEELHNELKEVRAKQNEVHSRKSKLHSDMQMHREHARSYRDQADADAHVKNEMSGGRYGTQSFSEDDRKKRCREKTAQHDAKVAEYAAALATVEKELAALDQREQEVYAKMREP